MATGSNSIEKWCCAEVGDWLLEQGLDNLVEAAKKKRLNGHNLLNMTADGLRELGIKVNH